MFLFSQGNRHGRRRHNCLSAVYRRAPGSRMSVLYFLILVGVLVTIHEFGHFLAAKLLDFKVTRFSLGFGQPLVRVRGRETEYQLALFPLGGYVRILGEEHTDDIPAADAHRAFGQKPLWQRLIVVFAGPAANFLLPVVIYFVAFAGHSELPAAVVGDVVEGSPAAKAGFEPGDTIVSVDGDSVRYWEDVEAAVDRKAGQDIPFRLRRRGKMIDAEVTPARFWFDRGDGKRASEGWIGITQAPYPAQVGVIDSRSPAGRAGLTTGDIIASIDGRQIETWTDLRQAVAGRPRRLTVSYLRANPAATLGVVLYESRQTSLVTEQNVGPGGRLTIEHGLYPIDRIVDRVEPDSPASRAGLRPGDLLVSIDGEPISHWHMLERKLRSDPDRTFAVRWRRAGQAGEAEAPIRQQWRRGTDDFGHRDDQLVFGAHASFDRGRGSMIAIDGRFTYAVSKSVEHTAHAIEVMATGLGSVLRGKSPSEELGGPIMMFQVAAVSGRQGWEALFMMIALVSISVGLINLLPVPVLDGGHIVVFALEAVRGRPLSNRARDRITVVGLAIVGLITILALRNDVVRYIM